MIWILRAAMENVAKNVSIVLCVAWAATAPISRSSSKFWGCNSASKVGKKRSGREGERQVEREREREKQRGRQIHGEGQVEGRGESS